MLAQREAGRQMDGECHAQKKSENGQLSILNNVDSSQDFSQLDQSDGRFDPWRCPSRIPGDPNTNIFAFIAIIIIIIIIVIVIFIFVIIICPIPTPCNDHLVTV
jgi:type IV secretory pathway VirB6-like protein